MIAESFNIPKTVVLRILKEDLRKRKLGELFVPHSLTPEQRYERVTTCQDIIATDDADNFLNKIITGDETWCFAYDPERKGQILNGLVGHPSAEGTEIPKVPHQEHIDHFFDSKEFVLHAKTVNAEFFRRVNYRLPKRIQRVLPAAFCTRDLFLLHDNAPAPKATRFCQFLTTQKMIQPFITPRTLQIYLCQTIFCSSS
jgi:hypothetical protein